MGISGLPNGAFPHINIPGFLANGLGWGQNQQLLVTVSNTFLLSDSLSMVKGKHNLKIGVDFRKLQNNLNVPSTSATSFSTTMRLPCLLAGLPPGTDLPVFFSAQWIMAGIRINEVTKGMRYPYFAAYFQDDIKLRPNFTLNLGLRWDYLPTMVEVNDVYSIMDPTVPNPAAGGRPGALILLATDRAGPAGDA